MFYGREYREFKGIVKLAKKYNALSYIDEVHAVGMYGKTGAGISEELSLQNDIDIIQGNLAKAYGNFGGYITSNSQYVITSGPLRADLFLLPLYLPVLLRHLLRLLNI